MNEVKKESISVLHIPEVCAFNEFINRISDIQIKSSINVARLDFCNDEPEMKKCSFSAKDVLRRMSGKRILHFHWPEKLLRNIDIDYFVDELKTLKVNGVKFVYTVHNLQPHEAMNREDGIARFYEYFDKNVDGYVVFSDYQKKVFSGMNPQIAREKICCIPHPNYVIDDGVQEGKSWHEKLNIPKDKKIIILLGRVRNYKNFDLFIDIARNYKKDDFYFVLAGLPFNEEIRDRIIETSKGVNNFRYYFDFLSEQDLHALLSEVKAVAMIYDHPWSTGVGILAGNMKKPLIGFLPAMFADYHEKIGFFIEEEMEIDKLIQLIDQMPEDNKEGENFYNVLSLNTDELLGNLYFNFYNNI